MIKNFVAMVFAVGLSSGATSGALASEHAAISPTNQIKWQRIDPAGTRFALLDGVRDKAGVSFTYAFYIPAGFWDGPHSHSADARVFVAKGVLRMGFGDAMNKARVIRYPAGSYVLVPAGATHFDGSDVDTVIYGVAVGPWSTTYVDAKAPVSAGTR
jgi:hypothetical protein